MRHRVNKPAHFWGKDLEHRQAMVKNLLTSFFLHKSLITTQKKAEAIAPIIDRLVNMVNEKDEMNAIRFVSGFLYTKESSVELFKNVAPKYKERKSGMTRITPIKYRDWDNAKVVKIELV